MASMLNSLTAAGLLMASLAGCSSTIGVAPLAQQATTTKAGTPAVMATPLPTMAGAAAGTTLAGSGASNYNDTPANGPQGIAVGEPAPGGRVAGGAAVLTPCVQAFITVDANGDGWVDLAEWQLAKAGADADFKAKDKDADGKLDRLEYGCEVAPIPPTGQPDGRG